MTPPARYWFPAKRYGYGWGVPRTWQGAAVLLTYLVVLLGTMLLLDPPAAAVVTLAASVVVVWIAWKKGEPPRWRWGR